MQRKPRKKNLLTVLRSRLGSDPYCTYCRRTLTEPGTGHLTAATRDHTIPLSHGGHRTVPCCQACNNVKGDMSLGEWNRYMAENPEWWTHYRRMKYGFRGGLPKILDTADKDA